MYVAGDTDTVVLVRWTDRNGQLVGSLDVTSTKATATGTSTTAIGFTGLRNDDHVSLVLAKPFGTSTTLTGSVHRSTLVLTFPGDDGQLVDNGFTASSVTDYNTRVAGLAAAGQRAAQATASASAQAAADAADAAQRQADAAAAAAAQRRSDDIVRAASGAYSGALVDLDDAANTLPDGVDPLTDAVTGVRTARTAVNPVDATAELSAKRCDPDAPGQAGVDASDVSIAANDVEIAGNDVDIAADTLQSAIDDVTAKITAAKTALTDQQRAVRDHPSSAHLAEEGASALPPVQDGATMAVRKAGAAITTAKATVKKLVDQADDVAAHASTRADTCDN